MKISAKTSNLNSWYVAAFKILVHAFIWNKSFVKGLWDPMILEKIQGETLLPQTAYASKKRTNSERTQTWKKLSHIYTCNLFRCEKNKNRRRILPNTLCSRKKERRSERTKEGKEDNEEDDSSKDASIITTSFSRCNHLKSSYSEGTGKIRNTFMAFGILFLLILFPNAVIGYELKPLMTSSQMTLAGERARLPCKISIPPQDRPTLILWYKDQIIKPFYSYDARETASGRHKIHDNSDLATRARFTLEKFPNKFKYRLGFLEVEGVTLRDAGNYTCRVDFWTSSTVMALLQLTVHEEIQSLEVFDGTGKMVNKIIGPYEESKSVILSCRAYGGYPSPILQWVSNGIVLQSSDDLTRYNIGTSSSRERLKVQERYSMSAELDLHLTGLQRRDDGREIKCISFNTNLTQPRSRELTIDLYLSPLEVKLEGLEKPLLSGIESVIQCRATGSKPPANLDWKLQGTSGLTSYPSQFSPNRNTTTRRARFTPSPSDNKRALTCLASNPKVPHYTLAASKTLQVYFEPEVEARLAPALDPDKIKEGEDVYFECVIKANPKETRVQWLHQGKKLRKDLAMGVLEQGRNLVLQKVSRYARGKYQCRVTNLIKTVTSNPTSLNVMFAPECRGYGNTTVSVTPTEEVKLNCQVDSNPPEVRFVWKVNSTRGVTDLDPSTYTSRGRTSTIVYRPTAHAIANDQYGVVFCQAINQLGIQKMPCMFVISPAGPPEEPRSCTLRNQSASSMAVICIPGHDGGITQHFIATVKNIDSDEVVANLSSPQPIFTVGGLSPGRDYLVLVKSVNNKGSSEPYILEGLALKVAENKIHKSNSTESSPLLAMFIGVVSGFIFILTILGVVNKTRGRFRRQRHSEPITDSNKYLNGEEGTPLSPSTNASLDDVEGSNENEEKDFNEVQSESPNGSLLTGKTVTIQTLGSSGSLTSRTYIPGPPGYSGSLPRSCVNPKQNQPLHSVDLPDVTSNNHKYYTLKINCTRQNNESFV